MRPACKHGLTDWPRVHADPEARALVDDVLVVVAHSFGPFDRRRDWFISLVNSHARTASDGGALLTHASFRQVMSALYADLREETRRDGWDRLAARVGQGGVDALQALFERLDRL